MTGLSRTVFGSGPDLVLVHGWGLHGGIWAELAPVLARRFHVTVIDLPGHGMSGGVRAHDIDACADALAAVVPETAIWLGWSLGATVLLHMGWRHRPKVEKLVLVGATPCFVNAPDWSWGMEPETLDAFARDLGTSYRATLQRFLSLQTGRDKDARTLMHRMRAELFRYGDPDPAGLNAGLAILRTADLRAQLPHTQLPCRVIHGARDRLVPLAAARFLADGLGAPLRVIASAGHVPFLSHPREFHAALDEFLND
ncbi:MAG: pimeloyl-ACP methyl ester esterase BioH [Acidiferrobacterales bacterium]